VTLRKFFKTIDRLTLIDRFIQDPDFVATQPNIAAQLGVSDRTVREDFVTLRELGAPTEIIGRPADGNGYRYSKKWNLQNAIVNQVKTRNRRGHEDPKSEE
jgi:predicted DNA-binding transcriptional regulator YafY